MLRHTSPQSRNIEQVNDKYNMTVTDMWSFFNKKQEDMGITQRKSSKHTTIFNVSKHKYYYYTNPVPSCPLIKKNKNNGKQRHANYNQLVRRSKRQDG